MSTIACSQTTSQRVICIRTLTPVNVDIQAANVAIINTANKIIEIIHFFILFTFLLKKNKNSRHALVLGCYVFKKQPAQKVPEVFKSYTNL
jgi:hypothetical protein